MKNEAVKWKNVIYTLGFIALCFVGVPVRVNVPDPLDQQFKDFVITYNKSYINDSVEYAKRLQNFKESFKRAANYNAIHNASNTTFGITKFSDLGVDEFQTMLLRHQPSPPSCVKKFKKLTVTRRKRKTFITGLEDSQPLPLHVDWREKNVITAVKNQYTCGACWAFSTVETVESMYAIRKGELRDLSIQQVIDCAQGGNQGCVGGDTCTALNWMSNSNITLAEADEYPLTLKTQKCNTIQSNSGIRLATDHTCYNLIGNEEQIKRLLAFHGPVTAAVDAITWQEYLGGIIEYRCLDQINHAVQIVGYDARGPIPYYIVRNSWGTDFGNKGYLHIAIGKNLCGIAREVSTLDIIS